ncbi:YhfC family intramembrane metalloprotease [Heliobacterium gestii]|uniref:YhfC family intramembrane metalloprotease n=1 Tax=Heliomicrobium gestii TaxID=2699 RepID=A0A845LDI7_HELGE|nr:YhfC family intramembrane metalloprotease [Heliomicrobium gestii]MBM7865976.1 putative membrane protein YhfC [Heliomicrobium gestii]MZP42689.1 YhfC family intramembrane metalloprotease [Heliomicrobium gestii]
MVSNLSFLYMSISVLLSIGVPVGLLIYLHQRQSISWKAVTVGALVWFFFTQGLEKMVHIYVFNVNPFTAEWLKHPLWFALYGALAAGIFEEAGRYIGFTSWLKASRARKDGVAYGLGHGGVESLLVGGIMGVQSILMARMINRGTLDTLGDKLSPEVLEQAKNLLLSTPPIAFLAGGLERNIALAMQIALSLLVLYGVRQGKLAILFAAIAAHAIIDFPVALYQSMRFDTLYLFLYLIILFAISLFFIFWSKRLFPREDR